MAGAGNKESPAHQLRRALPLFGGNPIFRAKRDIPAELAVHTHAGRVLRYLPHLKALARPATPLPAVRKRVRRFFYCQLICVFELTLDILCYLFSILACGVNAVSPTPKLPVALFAPQVCMPREDDHAFSLEEPYGAGNARLERPLYGHTYLVKAAFCFDVLLLLLLHSWQTVLLLCQKEFPLLAPRESLSGPPAQPGGLGQKKSGARPSGRSPLFSLIVRPLSSGPGRRRSPPPAGSG